MRRTPLFTKRTVPERVKTRSVPPPAPLGASLLAEMMPLGHEAHHRGRESFEGTPRLAPQRAEGWSQDLFTSVPDEAPERGAELDPPHGSGGGSARVGVWAACPENYLKETRSGPVRRTQPVEPARVSLVGVAIRASNADNCLAAPTPSTALDHSTPSPDRAP
jgi:hypothetical protein